MADFHKKINKTEDKQREELMKVLITIANKSTSELSMKEIEILDKIVEYKERVKETERKNNVLECSIKGDIRFSSLVAKVKIGKEIKTIEEHYQLSKRFKDDEDIFIPKSIKDMKGKNNLIHFIVLGKIYELKYLTAFYTLLWVKYLDNNPSLVKHASKYEDFNNELKGESANCQADIIQKYVKEGRTSLLNEPLTQEFIKLMKQKHCVRQVSGDLLTSNIDIIGHQVNCQGVMGAGIALNIKNSYPKVFEQYKELCNKANVNLMGKCLIVSVEGKILNNTYNESTKGRKFVANLFGQNNYGEGLRTEYVHLRTALVELRTVAEENDLWVGLPYQLGSGLAGGDWEVVKKMIEEVFIDYPVTIFKLQK